MLWSREQSLISHGILTPAVQPVGRRCTDQDTRQQSGSEVRLFVVGMETVK
jgi:hypothetical protein